jgi:hypothetical protein
VNPQPFAGAWRRVSIAFSGGAPDEPSDVLWLQARTFFADVRIPRRPRSEPAAFAGSTRWDPPTFTWDRRIDLDEPATDVATLEWSGGDLVERGEWTMDGSGTPYEEVWRRVPDATAGPILVLAREGDDDRWTGAIVRVGAYAIVMTASPGGFAAESLERAGDSWSSVGRVGEMPLPAVPTPDPDWAPGQRVELPGSGSWRVCELEPAGQA